MENKHLLGVFVFAVIAMLGVSAVSAHAFGLGFGSEMSEEERAEMEANGEAMQNAIETGDYAAWEGLMQERLAEMEDTISEETFAELQKRHENRLRLHEAIEEARDSGDWSEVEALKEEFGFGERGMGDGKHGGMMGEGRRMMAQSCGMMKNVA